MKKQFILNYSGNKYEETKKNLPEKIKNKVLSGEIETIIEPFGGSFGFSRFCFELNPNIKIKVYDNDKELINFYNFLKNLNDEQKTKFLNEYNETIDFLKKNITLGKNLDKKKFIEYVEKIENENLKFMLKKTCLILSICKPNYKKNVDFSIFENCEFIFKSFDDLELNDLPKGHIIYLDPPYLAEDNNHYQHKRFSSLFDKFIYTIKNFNCCFVHSFNPMIHYIFKTFEISNYEKQYSLTKNKTKHFFYYNEIIY